jgi:EAL and modified HD-GYP domain-containing signal transduction protein
MSTAVESDPRLIHVARQAILDARGHVIGYELLYRAGARDTACVADGDFAGARLLADAVLDLRLDTITDGRTAFINLTRSLLVNGAATLLRPGIAVFELREDIRVDGDVLEACRSLSSSGYRLALDDFVPGSPAETLLPFVSFVKVDVLNRPRDEVVELARRLAARGLPLVAEKVETQETFEWTKQAGCSLFQGYYFCRPQTRSGAGVPARLSHLRLLSALNQPRLSMDELEELVKQDAVLSLRVLQCINSAAFAIRREVRSIREALVLLGMGPIRKWASVWCLAKLNHGGPSELATISLLRARACELLAEDVDEADAHEMFLVGLCSVLDALVGRPMADAIADLPLSDAARRALLGERNPLRSILDAVVAYEGGSWDLALETGVSPDERTLPKAYGSALTWARELSAVNMAA